MDAAPLAMEEENLEITVFLTRHSHLNPHVSQRFQRSLPDLGRSLSQEGSRASSEPGGGAAGLCAIGEVQSPSDPRARQRKSPLYERDMPDILV
jgi:hypothetical protein